MVHWYSEIYVYRCAMSEQWDDAPAPHRQDGIAQAAALEQWNEVNVYRCTTSEHSGPRYGRASEELGGSGATAGRDPQGGGGRLRGQYQVAAGQEPSRRVNEHKHSEVRTEIGRARITYLQGEC